MDQDLYDYEDRAEDRRDSGQEERGASQKRAAPSPPTPRSYSYSYQGTMPANSAAVVTGRQLGGGPAAWPQQQQNGAVADLYPYLYLLSSYYPESHPQLVVARKNY